MQRGVGSHGGIRKVGRVEVIASINSGGVFIVFLFFPARSFQVSATSHIPCGECTTVLFLIYFLFFFFSFDLSLMFFFVFFRFSISQKNVYVVPRVSYPV